MQQVIGRRQIRQFCEWSEGNPKRRSFQSAAKDCGLSPNPLPHARLEKARMTAHFLLAKPAQAQTG
jgi:hypothetical protein